MAEHSNRTLSTALTRKAQRAEGPVLVSAKLPRDLHAQAKPILEKYNVSWGLFIHAAVQNLILDEERELDRLRDEAAQRTSHTAPVTDTGREFESG